MKKNILITFAGRKDRMKLLEKHVSSLLSKNIIHEWHVWDFTRNIDDKDYLSKIPGEIKYIRPDGGYQKLANIHSNENLKYDFNIMSDLHVAVKSAGEPYFYEFVFGGWGNAVSVIRRVDVKNFSNTNRQHSDIMYQYETPGVFFSKQKDVLNIRFLSDGKLSLNVLSYAFPDLQFENNINELEIYIKGGAGSSLEFFGNSTNTLKFIGDVGIEKPYWQAYKYYVERCNAYKDCNILKCDDDIIFIQEDGLKGFIDFIERDSKYFIVSANVINNGVCAYFQQKMGSLPEEVGYFEAPPGGFGGTLWSDGAKAQKLRKFFIENGTAPFLLERDVVEWDQRNSINFIGWRGENLKYMDTLMLEDEHLLTVSIPNFIKMKTAIYSNFIVSHLSFFPQENSVNPSEIISMYET